MRTRVAVIHLGRPMVALLPLLLWSEAVLAQVAPGQPDPVQSRLVLRPAATGAEVRHVTYRGPDGAELPADVYFDPRQTEPRPVLVLSAGTGDARSWGGFKDLATVAAQRGFAAVLPVRRFPRGGEGIRTGRADTLALLQQLGSLAPDVIDPNRVCLWGFSGGGTSLSVAYGPEKPKLSCVIGYYPAVSLTPFAQGNAEWLATYSAAHALERNGGPQSPPTLIVRAGKDTAQLNGMIAEFAAKALERNAPVKIVNLPDAQHGFDWLDDTEWARAAIEDSFAFAREKTQPLRPRRTTLADELLALERERQEAYVRGDRALLERHFAREYLHTNLRGGTTSRAQELDFYRPGSFSLASGTIGDVEVRDYGDTATLTGIVDWKDARYRPAPNANPIDLSGRFRVSRTYVWRDGRWQLAVSHASRIGG